MHKIAILASLLPVALFVTSVAFAQTTVTVIPDASNPNMERYCAPEINANVFAQIKAFEDQINALAPADPQRMNLIQKISKLTHQLKCVYRPIQN
ncbi:MAG: hypothetical protein V4525_08100 [Pseudomonadota bacterium]